MIDRSDGGQPQKRAQLTLDSKTGDVARWEPFSTLPTKSFLEELVNQIRLSARFKNSRQN